MVDSTGLKNPPKDTGIPNEAKGHNCPLCGTYVIDGYEYDVNAFDENGNRNRHWLSDCRPDLVEHEIGPLCTWPLLDYSNEEAPHSKSNEWVDQFNKEHGRPYCYAYQDLDGNETPNHIHFHKDGPM